VGIFLMATIFFADIMMYNTNHSHNALKCTIFLFWYQTLTPHTDTEKDAVWQKGKGRNFDDSIANHCDFYGSDSLHTAVQSKSSYLKVLKDQNWNIRSKVEIETFPLIRSWKFKPRACLTNNCNCTHSILLYRSTISVILFHTFLHKMEFPCRVSILFNPFPIPFISNLTPTTYNQWVTW
jgi:hypothetical protein